MKFSCKIILSEYSKEDGTQAVNLQAIINRKRAVVPLGFCLAKEHFNSIKQVVRNSHPSADALNIELLNAKGKAINIAAEYFYNGQLLTPTLFKQLYLNPEIKSDFIKFFEDELALRKPKVSANTHENHIATLHKLRAFKYYQSELEVKKKNKRHVITEDYHKDVMSLMKTYKAVITFQELTLTFLQKFENFLIEKLQNNRNTINKTLKNIRVHVKQALRKDYRFNDPFKDYKFKKANTNKTALSLKEFSRIVNYYFSENCTPRHRRVLQYFLFSCVNGTRLGDVQALTWQCVHEEEIVTIPQKTNDKILRFAITNGEKLFLPTERKTHYEKVFNTYCEGYTNAILKEIATVCELTKRLTFHGSRHTFATLFLSNGGALEVLKELLLHGDIKTTMIYAHITNERQNDERLQAVNKIITKVEKDGQNLKPLANDRFSIPKIEIENKNQDRTLNIEEMVTLTLYYLSDTCPRNHNRVLSYFIFSCINGLSLCDIEQLTGIKYISNQFQITSLNQQKTDKNIVIQISDTQRFFMPVVIKKNNDPIFYTYSEQGTNLILKAISKACALSKPLSYIVSRFTYEELFLKCNTNEGILMNLIEKSYRPKKSLSVVNV